jgi:hypothetical protein
MEGLLSTKDRHGESELKANKVNSLDSDRSLELDRLYLPNFPV